MIPYYDSVDIYRRDNIRDTDGITKNVAVFVDTIKCRFTDDTNSALSKQSGRRGTVDDKRKLYCDTDTDIKLDDTVFSPEGEEYRVYNIYRPRSFSLVHHIKVYLEAVEKGVLN